MPSVFIVHPIQSEKFNLPSVERYGDPFYVNQRWVYSDELLGDDGELPSTFLYNMRSAVSRFDPVRDRLLIAGDQLQLVVLTVLLILKHQKIMVLRWDRKVDGHVQASIDSSWLMPPEDRAKV